jgi:hypothetical protein
MLARRTRRVIGGRGVGPGLDRTTGELSSSVPLKLRSARAPDRVFSARLGLPGIKRNSFLPIEQPTLLWYGDCRHQIRFKPISGGRTILAINSRQIVRILYFRKSLDGHASSRITGLHGIQA